MFLSVIANVGTSLSIASAVIKQFTDKVIFLIT